MSLRRALIALGLLLLAAAPVAALCGAPGPALWLAGNGLVLSAGIAWERWRYRRPETERPGTGWQRTGERVVDPESGRVTEVWYRPDSGERRYVEPR